jgi:photosystem II stability/assembly factor-like uncharacterized protein
VTFGALLGVVAAIVAALPFGDLHWRSIGPAIAGGRVTSVAGSDADPFLYYFGAMSGGVWKTSDGGSTWSDVWGQKPVASIGAVAIAPSNTSVVWVGTGESNSRNDSSYGDGVWVSTNGGKSWVHRGLDSTFAISKILVSPRDPATALVGAAGNPYLDTADRGVYRTTDAGRTWTKTLYVGPESGISDLASDPTGKTVFAGVWQFHRQPWTFVSGGPKDGLYRSRDGGVTWQRLSGHGLPAGLMGRIGISISRSDPRVVYAVIQSSSGVVWRSSDGGDSWRLVNTDSYVDQRPFYMSRIAVDPTDPNHVISSSEDLVASRDGGRTFVNLEGAVHQDHHDFWWSADGKRMIDASDGSAAISLDGGTTWLWRFNVPLGQIYHVGYDAQNPYTVCGGMQDNDSFCGPSDSLDPQGILDGNWRDVGNDGDGSTVWPDPRDPSLIWSVGVNTLNGQLGVYDMRTREWLDVTPDVQDTTGATLAPFPHRSDWEAPVAFSPLDPTVAYYGAEVVFETVDRGRTWSVISPDLTLNDKRHQQLPGGPINFDASGAEFFDTILDIAPSPVEKGVIWVGTDDGLVQVTRDAGAHWQNVTMRGIGPSGRVECVEPSRFSAGSAFATVDRRFMGDQRPHVFATDDYGATWRRIDAGLPVDQYAHVVRQDPHDAQVLYLGLEQGVFVSLDGGRQWTSLQQDMPPAPVWDLRVQPTAGDLIAGTHGRSFFILDDLARLEYLSAARAAGVYLFGPRPAYEFYRWWTEGYGTGIALNSAPSDRFSGENPPPGALLSYYLSRPASRPPKLQVIDANGVTVRTLAATNHAGINQTSWDLTGAPPVPWRKARAWNQGPNDGAQVISGAYTIRLTVDGTVLDRPLVVKKDPRARWTDDDYQARYTFMRRELAQLSDIDAALNDLDARAARRPLTADERAVYAQLTSNPRNSEDTLFRPDRIREWLTTLLNDLAFSEGPPTSGHYVEAIRISAAADAALASYNALPKR